MASSTGAENRRLLLVETTSSLREEFVRIERLWAGEAQGVPASVHPTEVEARPAFPGPSLVVIDRAQTAEEAVELIRQSMWDGDPYSVAIVDPSGGAHWSGVDEIQRFWQIDPDLLVAVPVIACEESWRGSMEGLARADHVLPMHRPVDELAMRHLVAIGLAQRQSARLSSLKRDEISARVHEGTRKASETARFLEAVLESAPDAMVTIDERARIRSFNSAAESLFGVSVSEVLKQSVWELLVALEPETASRNGVAASSYWEGMAGGTSEVVGRRSNGGTFPAEVAVSQVGIGFRRWWTLVIRDLTARKQAEEEVHRRLEGLEAAKRSLEELCASAEAATRARTEFLANMSHEIRTPMTAILGFAENLLAPELTELDRAACVETIRRNGDHLLGIINDMLDLSRVEAGDIEIEIVPCCPGQLAVDVHEQFLDRARSKGLDFELELASPLPGIIRTDPSRLRQILVNVVGNAMKFTEHGKIGLAVDWQRKPDGQGTVSFRVSDTGIGMTEEETGRLFVPFSQGDSSTTRRFGGTGLGLAISKRLIDLLGGTIRVQSSRGTGSTFWIDVPAGCLGTLSMPDGNEQLSGLFGRPVETSVPRLEREISCRILLAEDSPDNQRLIRLVLTNAGAEVSVANNGQIAFEMAMTAQESGRPYDVVLMDIQMPVLDGFEATQMLRNQGYSGPILALTAHAMSKSRHRCLDAGCNDFLTKPVRREDLLAVVSRFAQSPRERQRT